MVLMPHGPVDAGRVHHLDVSAAGGCRRGAEVAPERAPDAGEDEPRGPGGAWLEPWQVRPFLRQAAGNFLRGIFPEQPPHERNAFAVANVVDHSRPAGLLEKLGPTNGPVAPHDDGRLRRDAPDALAHLVEHVRVDRLEGDPDDFVSALELRFQVFERRILEHGGGRRDVLGQQVQRRNVGVTVQRERLLVPGKPVGQVVGGGVPVEQHQVGAAGGREKDTRRHGLPSSPTRTVCCPSR